MTKYKHSQLYAGIDTLQVRSDTEPVKTKGQAPYMGACTQKNSKEDKAGQIRVKLNPDKANGGQTVSTKSLFVQTYNFMVEDLQLTNPVKARIDIRFDDLQSEYLNDLKLNKLLLLLVAQSENVPNAFESVGLSTQEALSVVIKHDSFEAEYYNKGVQEPYGTTKTRLELRAKRLNYAKTPEEEKEAKAWADWQNRFKKALTKDNYLLLQADINNKLFCRYQEQKNKKSFSVDRFIYKYENSIFTIAQLADLYTLLGVENAKKKAQNYRQRKGLEVFSLCDLRLYVDTIKKSAATFMKS